MFWLLLDFFLVKYEFFSSTDVSASQNPMFYLMYPGAKNTLSSHEMDDENSTTPLVSRGQKVWK